MDDEKKQQLRKKLNEIEQKNEDLRRKEQKFLKDEEDEEWYLNSTYRKMDMEAANCAAKDRNLFQLLEERRELLEKIRRDKVSFFDESKKWFSDKKRALELESEDILGQSERADREEGTASNG